MIPQTCSCCKLRPGPDRIDKTDKRPPICDHCVKHVGRADQRDQEHLAAWGAEYGLVRRSLEGRIKNMLTAREALEGELAAAKEDLAQAVSMAADGYFEAPIGALRNAIESDVVRKEKSRMEAALHSRSHVLAIVWKIDQLHNTAKGGDKCKCGKVADHCPELKALSSVVNELDRWEEHQKDRLTKGLMHDLPREHPAAIAERGRSWIRPSYFPGSNPPRPGRPG